MATVSQFVTPSLINVANSLGPTGPTTASVVVYTVPASSIAQGQLAVTFSASIASGTIVFEVFVGSVRVYGRGTTVSLAGTEIVPIPIELGATGTITMTLTVGVGSNTGSMTTNFSGSLLTYST